jgi:Asp/Glu/hydantoin racemase
VELQVGATAVTVGGTAIATVRKEQLKGITGVPVAEAAGGPTMIVMVAFAGNGFTGTNFAVKVDGAYVTPPGMVVVPGPSTVTDVPLTVLASMASLKVKVIEVRSRGTPVTPHLGVVLTTIGAGPMAVVKLQLKGTTGVPVAEAAGGPTMIVMVVFTGNGFTSAKFAVKVDAV